MADDFYATWRRHWEWELKRLQQEEDALWANASIDCRTKASVNCTHYPGLTRSQHPQDWNLTEADQTFLRVQGIDPKR